MVIAYAQSAQRQGLDAALNGEQVAANESTFLGLREKSIALNLATAGFDADGVKVRVGNGIVRLELRGAETDASTLSPIVVVAGVCELITSRSDSVRLASESVAALGRMCDARKIEIGFASGESRYRSIRAKWQVRSLAAISLGAATILLIARSRKTTTDIRHRLHNHSVGN